ncbi:carbamoyltransferase family protein [Candidatus Binatus sp.]|uniref:carbamoyltransferase family protein n=1 Tax=Candidatus Binatus sp. TaxID=2811406 RepID=UPI003CC5E189
MRVLGISAFYHDSAAALIEDGQILSAAQEERFTRRKHDARFPRLAIEFCLGQSGLSLSEIDYIAFYDKPFLKFERLLETYLAFAPRGFKSFRTAMPIWLREKLFQKRMLRRALAELNGGIDVGDRLLFAEHHQSHAASAFFASPFRQAVILTLDGVGEWATTSASVGNGNRLEMIKEIYFPHSLGLLYSAFTHYAGFKVNSGEYKLMGLAPYGSPRFRDLILNNLIDLKADGSFRLDLSYFDYCVGLRMTNPKFEQLFGGPARKPESSITQRDMDLAASIQSVTEEVVLTLTRGLAAETGCRNLCLAGGVALNCVANGKVWRDRRFENIWIQPAAGDAGGALGAALATYHQFLDQPRRIEGPDLMRGSYLGPSFSQQEIESRLAAAGARFDICDDETLLNASVDALVAGKALGWFQGRMEFGPRALGARSILADPRSPTAQRTLNLKIKFRESFRPFAPSVLREDVEDWFDLDQDSPYMMLVADVKKDRRRELTSEELSLFGLERLNTVRSEIPAVTHVDHSARIQTVHRETNPRYYALLRAFSRRTGCPILVNTSFNVRGEPIVCTPEDAWRCFMGTAIDSLAIGNCFLDKARQDSAARHEYSASFRLD